MQPLSSFYKAQIKEKATLSSMPTQSFHDAGPARPSEMLYPGPVPQPQPIVHIKEEPVEPQVKMEHINQLIKLGEMLLQLNSNDRFQKAQQPSFFVRSTTAEQLC